MWMHGISGNRRRSTAVIPEGSRSPPYPAAHGDCAGTCPLVGSLLVSHAGLAVDFQDGEQLRDPWASVDEGSR
jgi:hypothetical protein